MPPNHSTLDSGKRFRLIGTAGEMQLPCRAVFGAIPEAFDLSKERHVVAGAATSGCESRLGNDDRRRSRLQELTPIATRVVK